MCVLYLISITAVSLYYLVVACTEYRCTVLPYGFSISWSIVCVEDSFYLELFLLLAAPFFRFYEA